MACLDDIDVLLLRAVAPVFVFQLFIWCSFQKRCIQMIVFDKRLRFPVCVAAVDFDTVLQPQFAPCTIHNGLSQGKCVNSHEGWRFNWRVMWVNSCDSTIILCRNKIILRKYNYDLQVFLLKGARHINLYENNVCLLSRTAVILLDDYL